MGKIYRVREPEYVGKFMCDGDLCGAKCCKNWRIDIDEVTYRKYKKLYPKELREYVCSSMEHDKERGVYVVGLKKDGACPMLGEDKLCLLQKKFGKEMLSDVCAVYPRHYSLIGKTVQNFLSLSCPVAMRLILPQKEPMRFRTVEGELERNIFMLCAKEEAARGIFFLNLQETAIHILQNRKYSVHGRLILLGFLFAKLEELYLAGNAKDFPKVFSMFADDEKLKDIALPLLESVEFDMEQSAFFLLNYAVGFGQADIAFKTNEKSHGEFIKLMEVLGIFPKEEATPEKYLARFKEAYENYKGSILGKYDYILENFLVNEFFGDAYPFYAKIGQGKVQKEVSFGFAYKHFVLNFKWMELFLMGLAMEKQNEGVGEEDVLGALVWTFERMHHGNQASYVGDYLREHPGGKNIMDFMRLMLDCSGDTCEL